MRRYRPFILVALLCASAISLAQSPSDAEVSARTEPAVVVEPVGDRADLRFRYGFALRQGEQQDLGPGLSYSGLTPNDLALGGAYFLDAGHFGLSVALQREGFGLFDSGALVARGALLRADLGPTGRLALGPLELAVTVGYSYAQLPVFGNSAAPEWLPASRHSLLLAARAMANLPAGWRIELSGQLPVALAADDGQGNPATATGYEIGAAISLPFLRTDSLIYAVVVDYHLVTDKVERGTEVIASQNISRVGAGFELRFQDPAKRVAPARPATGGLLLSVVDADSGAVLLPDTLTLAGGTPVPLGPDGRGTLESLNPGPVTARATAPGYLPGEATFAVVGGKSSPYTLTLKKEPPKTGSLTLTLVDQESASPVVNARIGIAGKEYRTSPAGQVTIDALPPGNTPITVNADGYQPLKEIASVVAGKGGAIPLQLVRAQKAAPAILTGSVRSTRGGKAVRAELSIPQAKVKIRANAAGAFTQKLEPGTYNVIISAPGFLTQAKTVTVREGEQAIFNVDLSPDSHR